MKLLGSSEKKITKDKDGESVPHSDITEVVLVHCNYVNNDYQHYSKFLYTSVPDKFFGQLLDIPLKHFIFLGTFNSEFSYTVYWSKSETARDRR